MHDHEGRLCLTQRASRHKSEEKGQSTAHLVATGVRETDLWQCNANVALSNFYHLSQGDYIPFLLWNWL